MKRPQGFSYPVYVTRSVLPPLEKLQAHLVDIWSSRILSNQGPKHAQFESALRTLLRAANVTLFSNGTLALTLGLRALDVTGEVITTPFTFPATPHAIVWSGATPVFCDIDPVTLCIDPVAVERMITSQTTAILGVHVYGMACDVAALQEVADRHDLKLIYDAAHAFGTEVNGTPIGQFGDLSMFSFHATKLFHSVEGGCLIYRDEALGRTLDLLKNFGIASETSVELSGLNAKLNEIQAIIGLLMIDEIAAEQGRRRAIRRRYRELLPEIEGISSIKIPESVTDSLQYMPIIVDETRFGLSRDKLYVALREFNIYPRKYFYPLCTDYVPYLKSKTELLPNATYAAQSVLCLPFYGEMGTETVDRICDIMRYIQETAFIMEGYGRGPSHRAQPIPEDPKPFPL
ncbi:MAG: DegT/DnrJ/EryC1/StrS family aminotransferase [Thermoplasmataceae archaeon]